MRFNAINKDNIRVDELLTLNFTNQSYKMSQIPVYTPLSKEGFLETVNLISENKLTYGLIKYGSRHIIRANHQEQTLIDVRHIDNITDFDEKSLTIEPGCLHQQILGFLNHKGIKGLNSIKIADLIKDDLPSNHINQSDRLNEITIPVEKNIEPNKWICIGLQSFANIYNSLAVLNEIRNTLSPMICSISCINRPMLKRVRNKYLIENSLNLLDLDFDVQMEGYQWFILIEAKCSEMTIPIVNEFLSSKLGNIYHKHPLVKRWLFKMGMKANALKPQSLDTPVQSKFELMEIKLKNDPVILLKMYHAVHCIFQKAHLDLMMLIEIDNDDEVIMTIRSEFHNENNRNLSIDTFAKILGTV